MQQLHFYFDFVSPYAHLAWMRAKTVLSHARLHPKPVLLEPKRDTFLVDEIFRAGWERGEDLFFGDDQLERIERKACGSRSSGREPRRRGGTRRRETVRHRAS